MGGWNLQKSHMHYLIIYCETTEERCSFITSSLKKVKLRSEENVDILFYTFFVYTVCLQLVKAYNTQVHDLV